MKNFRYIDRVATLVLDQEQCIGCRMCTRVCPQSVFAMHSSKVSIVDQDACMECGACSINCPTQALRVDPGTGCAALIVSRWLRSIGINTGGCC